jgi:hypothetical protein
MAGRGSPASVAATHFCQSGHDAGSLVLAASDVGSIEDNIRSKDTDLGSRPEY